MADLLKASIGVEFKGQAGLNQAAAAIGKTEVALKKLAPGSDQATLSMINLSRVVQDAPYGFIGIANNLNPLLESFQRLKASTGTTGGALRALGSSLTGAGGLGLALGVVTTVLTFATTGFGAWTRGLFGAKKGADDLTVSIANLAQQAEDAKDNFKSFEEQVKFLERLGSVTVDFNFEKGFERDKLKLQQKSVNLDTEIFDGEKTLKTLEDVYQQSWKFYEEEGSRALTDLSTQFSSFRVIPDAAIEKLSETDKEIAKQLKKSAQDVYDFQLTLEKKKEERTIARANIRVAIAEEERKKQKEILDKQKSDYDKYVNETISRGKELAKFFEGRRIVPNFGIFDSKEEQLKKAKKVIDDFNKGALGIIFRPLVKIEPQFAIENGYVKKEVEKRFKDLNEGATGVEINIEPPKINLSQAFVNSNKELIEQFDKLKRLAEVVAGSISNSFSQTFSEIANGKNVFESLGEAIKRVVIDLIQAAIRGLIFKAVMNIILPGSGTATAGIGGLIGLAGRRALGGPVGAGRSYLVGENGPELFTPGISGNIVPNGRLGSVSNSFGGMQVSGVLVGRGNDLVAVINAAGRSNGRLV